MEFLNSVEHRFEGYFKSNCFPPVEVVEFKDWVTYGIPGQDEWHRTTVVLKRKHRTGQADVMFSRNEKECHFLVEGVCLEVCPAGDKEPDFTIPLSDVWFGLKFPCPKVELLILENDN